MTFEERINELRAVALEVNPNGTFMYGRFSDGSLDTVSQPPPWIHVYPTRNRIIMNPHQHTITPILMGFYQQDTLATSNEQREQTVAQMAALAKLFMDTLYDRDRISYAEYEEEDVYRVHSGTVSGMAVRFNLVAGESC